MKQCPRCGGGNHDFAQWCQFCGLQFQPNLQPQSNYPTYQNYQNPIQENVSEKLPDIDNDTKSQNKNVGCGTLLLWTIFFPIKFSIFAFREKKLFLYVIAVVVWMFYSFTFFMYNSITHSPEYTAGKTATAIYKAVYATYTEAARPTRTTRPTETLKPTPTLEIDSSVKAIMKGTGLNKVDSEKALAAIRSVGFENVYSMEFQKDYEGLKGYIADVGYTKMYNVTLLENEVFGISNSTGTVFYDRDAGGALDNIHNYTLSSDEKGTFIYATKELVKSSLKSPSTAKFPSDWFGQDQWSIGRKKDVVSLQSWVDAENSFGAKIRSIFTTQYSYSTKELLYLQIDGTIVFGTFHE